MVGLWASVIGLLCIGAGIIVGFYVPDPVARAAADDSLRGVRWIQRRRSLVGIGLVLVGIALQIWVAWLLPR